MANTIDNVPTEEQLTPEEVKTRRAELTNFYKDGIKHLKVQKEYETLKNYLYTFQGSDEFKKIVIKDKLFYKDKNEKVYLYD